MDGLHAISTGEIEMDQFRLSTGRVQCQRKLFAFALKPISLFQDCVPSV